MSEKIIVLVTDRGDSKHGEISVVDDPHRAEKLVETLLEAGFEQDRIRVFAGRQSDFEVSQRPVVALVGEGEEEEPQIRVGEQEAPQVRVAEQGAPVPEPAPAPALAAEEPATGSEQGEEGEAEEEVAATAQAGAPVKFSSLFRSA